MTFVIGHEAPAKVNAPTKVLGTGPVKVRKEEIANTMSKDIVCGLDIERLFDLGIWSADEMEEDQSRD
ncbi:MAG: hypothetical protein Q9221_004604 [Calogaya cf. arnoldii]